jgi:hypothetical protein
MEYDFKPGDIVVLKETENTIGWLNLSLQSPEQREKDKARYRKWRGEIIRIREEALDKDGDPIALIRRLDTKAHGRETMSQALLAHAES